MANPFKVGDTVVYKREYRREAPIGQGLGPFTIKCIHSNGHMFLGREDQDNWAPLGLNCKEHGTCWQTTQSEIEKINTTSTTAIRKVGSKQIIMKS